MRLNAKEDIEAPIDFVYAALSDFEGWERMAMRRGTEVERTDTYRTERPGMGWNVKFPYRGKSRVVDIKLLEIEANQNLTFMGTSAPAEGRVTIDLAEMGPRRTRVIIIAEIKPRTIAARVFIQSLRLAKAQIRRKFEIRVAQVAAEIEDRHRAKLKA